MSGSALIGLLAILAQVRAEPHAPLPPVTPAAAPSAADLEAAQRAAERGRVQYELGAYPQAVERFEEAYRLSGNHALLFNIAQSYRLAGNCMRAMEVYRHFLRLAPDSPARMQAETHLDVLRTSCKAPAEAAAPVAAPIPRRSRRRILGLVALSAGAFVGASAGGLFARNTFRFADWRREDQALRSYADPAGTESWLRRQHDNNQLWTSIRNEDRASTVMAVAAGALVTAGLVLVFGQAPDEAAPRAGPRAIAIGFAPGSLWLYF